MLPYFKEKVRDLAKHRYARLDRESCNRGFCNVENVETFRLACRDVSNELDGNLLITNNPHKALAAARQYGMTSIQPDINRSAEDGDLYILVLPQGVDGTEPAPYDEGTDAPSMIGPGRRKLGTKGKIRP